MSCAGRDNAVRTALCPRAGDDAPSVTARRVLIIVNPAAGRARRSARRLKQVIASLERLGCQTVLSRTRNADDAGRLAREAGPEIDLVVAAGGDGTANAVATGLLGSGRPMAILPLGTANVLAREIGLPKNPVALAALIAGGRPQPLWPGRLDDRLFLMMAGCGFDAAVVAAVRPGLKRWAGKLAFAWAILVCLYRYRGDDLAADIDGVEYRAASVIIAKGRHYAGRFVLAPAARVADPVLHVVLFQRFGRFAPLRYLAALMLGVLHRLPDVAVVAARKVSLAGTANGPVHVDGEIAAYLPVAIAVADTPLPVVQGG